jgi:hypothetical protein
MAGAVNFKKLAESGKNGLFVDKTQVTIHHNQKITGRAS